MKSSRTDGFAAETRDVSAGDMPRLASINVKRDSFAGCIFATPSFLNSTSNAAAISSHTRSHPSKRHLDRIAKPGSELVRVDFPLGEKVWKDLKKIKSCGRDVSLLNSNLASG